MIQLIIIVFGISIVDFVTVWGIERTFPQFISSHQRKLRIAFIILAAVSILLVFWGFIFQDKISDYRLLAWYYYFWGVLGAIYLPKSFYVFLLMVDWTLSKFSKLYRRQFDKHPRGSRQIIAKCGFWSGLALIGLIVWSIFFGRSNFKVDQVDIYVDDLPNAFHGYKIALISDIHAGSFSASSGRFQKAVDLINQQEPNLIVSVGDIVNNFAGEILNLIPIFSQLEANDGKYAVLGNHDYGGYYKWNNPADSVANFYAIINAVENMGFEFLNNQAVVISRYNADRMALIGVENWGVKKRHPKRANLEVAMASVKKIPFKVLLSHNPLYWHKEVEGKTDITLTLSGHTHGMQMGIKLGKKYFSLASLLGLPYGAGLYQSGKQYLYVNRGLGVVGFPGRFGMSPEISIISLWKEKKSPEQQ